MILQQWLNTIQVWGAELNVITMLTVGAVVLNVVVAIRALALAQALESGCIWVCRTVGNHCVIRTLQGIATICFMLAVLKGWSIADTFTNYWYEMSETYHVRAFAYLGENYGVAMLGYAVTSVFKSMTQCTTADKYSKLQKEIKKNGVEICED